MKKIMKNFSLILLGILIGCIATYSFSLLKQQQMTKKEQKRYQIYLEKYVKRKGEAEHVFSENPPIKIKATYVEHRQSIGYDFLCYSSNFWIVQFQISNLSKQPCQISYFPYQLDYLVDGNWYECSAYGFLRTTVDPESYTLAPEEIYTFDVPIDPPTYDVADETLPYFSGRFWYGRYRLVISYAENELTYVEFDIPETAGYFKEPLYPYH